MILGSDIALIDGEIQVAANGEVKLVNEHYTVIQDIYLRLTTYYKSLFYNSDYGSYLFDYISEEDSDSIKSAICTEVIRRVESDSRVKDGSAFCEVLSFLHSSLSLNIGFEITGKDSVFNLVLTLDKTSEVFKWE